MTPSTELRTAAEKLRKLITAVPNEGWGDRPWHAEECSEEAMQCCPCIVAQGEYREFDQPQVPLIQYVADAETPEFAAYITVMHPGVGAAIAKWLESWVGIDFNEHAAMAGDLAHALAVARQINGGQP